MKKFKHKIYHWLIVNLPNCIMYKYTKIDSQHEMFIPRWGWSKQQSEDATKKANELNELIKWE